MAIYVSQETAEQLHRGNFVEFQDIQNTAYSGFILQDAQQDLAQGIGPKPNFRTHTHGYSISIHPQEPCHCIQAGINSNGVTDINQCSCPPYAQSHNHCGICHGVQLIQSG